MAARLPVVGDLLAINQHLEIYCYMPGCRRQVRLSAIEAVNLLGAGRPFVGLPKRLKCAACGQRGRNGYIDARPCTLDGAAWGLRQKYAASRDQPGRLEDELAILRRLLGGRGELGGDGPVEAS